uniref:SH3 domain-containing protein n=1 Tax=Plectus sambesii TaxID=2011161 RepID=A0A914VLT0_9BILA
MPNVPLQQKILTVVQDYKAIKSNRISLRVDEKVRQIQTGSNGWILGYNMTTRMTGWFPQEVVQEDDQESHEAPNGSPQ